MKGRWCGWDMNHGELQCGTPQLCLLVYKHQELRVTSTINQSYWKFPSGTQKKSRGFLKWGGTPNSWMVSVRENHTKIDDLRGTRISGTPHIFSTMYRGFSSWKKLCRRSSHVWLWESMPPAIWVRIWWYGILGYRVPYLQTFADNPRWYLCVPNGSNWWFNGVIPWIELI